MHHNSGLSPPLPLSPLFSPLSCPLSPNTPSKKKTKKKRIPRRRYTSTIGERRGLSASQGSDSLPFCCWSLPAKPCSPAALTKNSAKGPKFFRGFPSYRQTGPPPPANLEEKQNKHKNTSQDGYLHASRPYHGSTPVRIPPEGKNL